MATLMAEPVAPTAAPFAIERQESDGELILRVAKGDAGAFEELYGRFARPVLGMAQRLLGDVGRAEDATQETFTSVWRSAGSFRPELGSASSWLFTVARNSIIDRARQRWEPTVATAPDEPAPGPDPSDAAEASWRAWQVHVALERLPEREREVLELAYWRGLSQSEVAARLDLPLGTVKTRTRAGLSRMAVLLEEVDL
jgi:RNA polymerase sigma-70 factor (ECF subfamily)